MSEPALSATRSLAAAAAWASLPLAVLGWILAVPGAFLLPAGWLAAQRPVYGDNMAGIGYVLILYGGAGTLTLGLLSAAMAAGIAWATRATAPQSLQLQRRAALLGGGLAVLAAPLGALFGWVG